MKKRFFIGICIFLIASGAISFVWVESILPIGCARPGFASSLETGQNRALIDTSGITLHSIRIVNVYPHNSAAFTQGLVFHSGYIYEGTGIAGRSSICKVELKTGRVLRSQGLPAEYFGEGITICRNRLIQLTWQSHIGFIYDLQSFRLLQTFSYPW
ncbi:MAG: glutaminyl-peptide cyclotransferase, partial [Syntrophales bacterium]